MIERRAINAQEIKMIKIAAILAALLITSCTTVRYTSGDTSLTVLDLHPGGETISLSGVLDDTGTLDVNREQGSSSEVITATGEAVRPSLLN